MIDFGKILKRAWQILWDYKVLWIFGILLVLTAGGNGSGNGGGGNTGYQFSGNDQPYFQQTWHPDTPEEREFLQWFEQSVVPLVEHPGDHVSTWIWIGVVTLLIFVVLGVIGALIHYPSETALFRMVDGYEATGEKVGFKAGWKLGWTRRAFRMWVIDLVVNLPLILFGLLMFGMVIVLIVNAFRGNEGAIIASALALAGGAMLLLFPLIVLMAFLGLLRQFFARQAALEGAGIGESFRQGWAMFKRNWKSAGLMWLIMFGIGLGYIFGTLLAVVLFIPIYALLALPAVLLALIPGMIAYLIANLFTGTILAVIIGILAGIPLFIMVMFAPLVLLGGWYAVFRSNVWTLAYREIKALAPPAE